MGFLNNSGDIILDAVLTDTGRMRLARGDGSFTISKFALADDEIDYGLFVSNTGSAFQDIQILQTPVFEAFTNNASSMKSKLMSVNMRDILYLPVMKINPTTATPTANVIMKEGFLVAVDKTTEEYLFGSSTTIGGLKPTGILRGWTTSQTQFIRIDQGIDNDGATTLPGELLETQYILEIDNRFGTIINKSYLMSNQSYIDDDNIASYIVSLGVDNNIRTASTNFNDPNAPRDSQQVINGPRGSILEFAIDASLSLKSSPFLFNTVGTTLNITRSPSTGTLRAIYSTITVTGATTGYSIAIPVAFLKYTT